MMLFNTNLPIEEVIPDIRQVMAIGRNAVLEAPPGAGKTTLVPLTLLEEPWLKGRRIVMLEPRRLAARAAAMRMAALLGEEVGKTVGYRTRLDSRIGPSTRVEVVTEGILTRFLQSDPSLEGIGLVIFDEFHERSIHADLGLALCLETQTVLREELRILIMSATLDGQEVASVLGNAPIVKSEGRSFPVETRYSQERRLSILGNDLTGPSFISAVTNSIIRAIRNEQGSILVFLPGGSEIRRVESKLNEGILPPNIDIVPLYGDLPLELQDKAIRPSPPGRRKIVLATSIAETSLTIDGVRVVIDGGLMRISRFSPATGMSRLETVSVTRASADQRRGRAGRLEPGVCLRLWAETEGRTIKEQNTPEILEADLTPLALELAAWGAKDAGELRWLDPPPPGALSHARELLVHLGAMDKGFNVTSHGKEMARMGLHPRLAHMVLRGNKIGVGNLACDLAAILTERDVLKMQQGQGDSDLRLRVEALQGQRANYEVNIDRGALERAKKASMQLKKQLNPTPYTHRVREPLRGLNPLPMRGEEAYDINKIGLLLAFAYPDRIGKRRSGGEGRYLLANGRGALFPRPDPLSSEEYIVAASLDGRESESRIFLAAPVAEAELLEYLAQDIVDSESVSWDSAQKAVAARRQKRLWSLVMSDSPIKNPREEDVLKAFLSGIREAGLDVLPWDKVTESLRARVNFMHRTGEEFPELSDEWLLNNLDDWLAPWLKGMTRLEHLKRLELRNIIMGMLTWKQQQALDKLAPTHITVPSGSRIPIDYLSGNKPVLAVRLQEMFGLDKTPAIANGKVPLLLHLLSPAGHPMQVTEDLAGFWTNSYILVKKDLKGRYPKHYWPDDPLIAEPTRRAKRRGE